MAKSPDNMRSDDLAALVAHVEQLRGVLHEAVTLLREVWTAGSAEGRFDELWNLAGRADLALDPASKPLFIPAHMGEHDHRDHDPIECSAEAMHGEYQELRRQACIQGVMADKALLGLRRIAEMHSPSVMGGGPHWCPSCGRPDPCGTRRVAEGALSPSAHNQHGAT